MRWFAVVVCAVMLAGVARAQVPAPSDLGDDDASRKARAKREADKGKIAYNLGKWQAAEGSYERAYVEWPIPDMLFNLCQARRQLQKWEEAIANCRAYLRDAPPTAENRYSRQTATNHLRNMVDQLAQARATAQRPPTEVIVPAEESDTEEDEQDAAPSVPLPATERRRSPWYSDGWAWGLTGAGVAVAAVGGGFLISAADLEDQATAVTDQREIAALNDRASSRRLIGGGFLLVGAGVAIVGVVKFIVPNYAGGENTAVASTHVLIGRGFVGFGGRF